MGCFAGPVSETNRPLPEPHRSRTSPFGKGHGPHSSLCCIAQTFREITKWEGKPHRNKLSKDYIGTPHNFKHLCHIRQSPQAGFSTELDPELRIVFAQAGITQAHLKDKRTSKKIFETIEEQGGIEAVLKEVKAEELGSAGSPKNALHRQTPEMKDGHNDILTMSPSLSKSHASSYADGCPLSISPALDMSPSKKASHYNLIQNLKEVQLRRAKGEHQLTPNQDAVMSQMRKGTQVQPVPQTPMIPSDGGIVAALKAIIQKRHQVIHVSENEESDLESGDEWDD